MSKRATDRANNRKVYLIIFLTIAVIALAVTLVIYNISKPKNSDPEETQIKVQQPASIEQDEAEDSLNSTTEDVPEAPEPPIIELPQE